MMKYAIAVLRYAEPPDICCLEMPQFYESELKIAAPRPFLFHSLPEAQKIKDELEIIPYITTKGELRKPDFYIVNYIVADYVISGRFGKDEKYPWQECHCTKDCGFPCMECYICMKFRIISDRKFIREHQATMEGVKSK